jgi:hypothetical protein
MEETSEFGATPVDAGTGLAGVDSGLDGASDRFVGGIERPPRLLTIGRRRADRWFYRAGIALMALMAAFILYTSAQQARAEEDRQRSEATSREIVEQLRQQNHDLLCFASNTQQFEIAVGEFLLQAQPAFGPADDPNAQRLRDVEEALRRSEAAQARDPIKPACAGTR